MKSTGTKRVLSVLSAGALVASMSAIPVFAATPEGTEETLLLQGTAITVGDFGTGNSYTYGNTSGFAWPVLTVSVKEYASGESDKWATTPTTKTVATTADDWDVTLSSQPVEDFDIATAKAGTYNMALKSGYSVVGKEADGKKIVDQDPSAWGTAKPASPSTLTINKKTITISAGTAISKGTTNEDAIAAAKAAFEEKYSDGVDLASCTYIVKSGSGTGSVVVTVGAIAAKDADNYTVSPATIDYTVTTGKTAVPKEVKINGSANKTEEQVKQAAIDAVKTYFTAAPTAVSISPALTAPNDKTVAGMTYEATVTTSSLSPETDYAWTGGVGYDIKVTYTVPKSDSDEDDSGSSGSTDNNTDFSSNDVKTETSGGVTKTFASEDAVQQKLNSNKGDSFSIGDIKKGSDLVASFTVTLPKNAKSVSSSQVAKVINVLNTINTKSSESKAAQTAVSDLLNKAEAKNTQSMPVSFSKSMDDFGMTVSVTVPVTSKFTNGGTLLYYYNPSSKTLEKQNTTVAIRGGKATFDLTHASDYFLIEGIKDLSAGEGANDSEDTLSSTEATTAATSEAPVVTAPEVTEPAPVDTTVPSVATNPGTGNAPIALAVIPVAVAAAAIIAKKAK